MSSRLRALLTPKNVFAIVMLIIIVVSGAILFMCLVGMIKFSEKSTKDAWIEITSQILNACFTLNALLLAPGRTKDFVQTIQAWRAQRGVGMVQDISMWKDEKAVACVRQLEKRNASWLHVFDTTATGEKVAAGVPIIPWRTWVWVMLLNNANGWFQIPMTVAMWMYAGRSEERPFVIVAVSLPLSFLCGAAGGLWPWIIQWKAKKRREKERATDDDAGVTIGEDIEKPY